MEKIVSLFEFQKRFSDADACYSYLAEQKWSSGYCCRKCNHTVSILGRTRHHRRCQKCGYDESSTAHTAFHKLKFSIVKAFAITYILSNFKKSWSTVEIARQFSIHQETAWFFKRKIQQTMGSHSIFSSRINCRETADSLGVMILHKFKKVKKRRKINSFSAQIVSFPRLNKKERKKPRVFSDKERFEDSLAFCKTTDDSGNYPAEVSLILSNWKRCMQGVCHHISIAHFQRYLDEFSFRLSKCEPRQMQKWENLFCLVVRQPWISYKTAIAA